MKYLFTKHGLVGAVCGSLVEGDWDDRLTQSRQEEEETAGHGVGGAWELSSPAHIQSIDDLLHLHLTTSLLEQVFLQEA